jgi:SAM-dependent methyltransferase
VSKPSIRLCQSVLSRRYKNFRFQHADVFNREYNPSGRTPASEYALPFRDHRFDFVLLTSVFTHMLPPEIRRYLAETSRVLAQDGRLFATFFLIPEGRGSAPTMQFDHESDEFRTVNPEIPEQAVAVSEANVRSWYADAGLRILEPVHRGGWSGIQDALTFQDLVLATRE